MGGTKGDYLTSSEKESSFDYGIYSLGEMFFRIVDNGVIFCNILGSVVVAQSSAGVSSVRSVPWTSVKKKPDVVPARQTTSISSPDDSDDDDLDGDT